MSSPSVGIHGARRPLARGVRALLDAMFGFFVWAEHLLAIYVPTALACQFGLGGAGGGTRTSFAAALAVLTVIAVAVVALHAFRRYRQQRDVPDRRFRMSVTIGCDAIATVAIVWQLLAIVLVPICV